MGFPTPRKVFPQLMRSTRKGHQSNKVESAKPSGGNGLNNGISRTGLHAIQRRIDVSRLAHGANGNRTVDFVDGFRFKQRIQLANGGSGFAHQQDARGGIVEPVNGLRQCGIGQRAPL